MTDADEISKMFFTYTDLHMNIEHTYQTYKKSVASTCFILKNKSFA